MIAAMADYQRSVEELRLSPYMDYPHEVSIETLTICNAACEFCPYPTLERKGTKMPDSLIGKIIADLKDIPVPFGVSPFKVNDPLLDSRIFDIVGSINQLLPQAAVRMFTNGAALSAKNIDRLGALDLEHLWVSLNHHEAEEYKRIVGLPFERTLERLDNLHEAKASGRFSHDVFVSRVSDADSCSHTDTDLAFVNFVKERWPLFKRAVAWRSSWLGDVKTQRMVPLIGCARWFELSITATGVVAFCCMDGKAKYPIGDVSKQHVLEVYNNPAYRVFRERYITRMEASPCLACTHF